MIKDFKKMIGFLFLYNWGWTSLDKCNVIAIKLFCFGLPYNKSDLIKYMEWHLACKYDIWPHELREGADILLKKLIDAMRGKE